MFNIGIMLNITVAGKTEIPTRGRMLDPAGVKLQ
jgi:hypothetical protein